MSSKRSIGVPPSATRYESFRDASGSWTFDIGDYRKDINTLTPVNIPPNPGPTEAYKAAVFVEGFIQSQMNTSNWSEESLDQFEQFGSTLEIKAVAKALREIARQTD